MLEEQILMSTKGLGQFLNNIFSQKQNKFGTSSVSRKSAEESFQNTTPLSQFKPVSIHESFADSSLHWQETSSSCFTTEEIGSGRRITKYIGPKEGQVIIPAQIDGIKVTEIGAGAFSGCTGLTNIIIPGTVIEIWYDAFNGCSDLVNITVPDSVIEIGESAFACCTNLASFNIPKYIQTIELSAFICCESLTNITIPGSLSRICMGVFQGCSNLTNVTIQKGVEAIGPGAFEWCINLSNIIIPNSITEIRDDAFMWCSNLTIHTPAGSYAEQYARKNRIPFSAI